MKRIISKIKFVFLIIFITLALYSCGNSEPEILSYTPINDGKEYAVNIPYFLQDDPVIEIPATYKNKPVTTIKAFDGDDGVLIGVSTPSSIIHNDVEYLMTNSGYVKIPAGITNIEDGAFYVLDILGISIDENNEKYKLIDGSLYTKDGKKLIRYIDSDNSESFNIPDSVTEISSYAFYECKSLKSITIPDNVTDIGDCAFCGCINLQNIEIPASVKNIGAAAFFDCKNANITVNENNNAYKTVNGTLYSKDGTTLIRYATDKQDKEFIIPNGVTSIADYALGSCLSLISVTIPESVTKISTSAFKGSIRLLEVYNKSSFKLPKFDEHTYNTFYLNMHHDLRSYVRNVYTPNSGESKLHYSDDGYIFYSDGDTVYLLGYNGDDTELTLPEDYNGKNYSIYNYAFSGCTSLTSVTIPDSVKDIGGYAFSGCTSLTDVYFGGTEDEWKAIIFLFGNEYLYNAAIHYNYVPENQ